MWNLNNCLILVQSHSTIENVFFLSFQYEFSQLLFSCWSDKFFLNFTQFSTFIKYGRNCTNFDHIQFDVYEMPINFDRKSKRNDVTPNKQLMRENPT